MTRSYSNHGLAVRQERRADRLQLRADQLGRRSARDHGVILSLTRMAELRRVIASGILPDTICKVGKVGRSADAYVIDFTGRKLVAIYDRRAQSIAAFLASDADEIDRCGEQICHEPASPASRQL
jgi:hypothetical protein